MTHVRKQIRDKLVQYLTGLTTTDQNVFNSHPYDAQEANSLFIYTTDEEISADNMGRPITQMRELTLRLEAIAKGNADVVPDTLDQIAVEVEHAIYANRTLDGLVLDIDLNQTEMTFSGDGDAPTGGMRLTYVATYRTKENAVDTAI